MRNLGVVLILMLLLVLVIGMVSCSSGGGQIADMMNKLPTNVAHFGCYNLNAMLVDYFLTEVELERSRNELKLRSIEIEDLDYGVAATMDDPQFSTVAIYSGDFNTSDIRDSLSALGFTELQYLDTEVWQSQDEEVSCALTNNLYIEGNSEAVRDCIEVINGAKKSFYDNRNARAVIDRLPIGDMLVYDIWELGVLWKYPYSGDLEAYGTSISYNGGGRVGGVDIYMFEDEGVAFDMMDEVKDGMESVEPSHMNFDISLDGRFIEVTWVTEVDAH